MEQTVSLMSVSPILTASLTPPETPQRSWKHTKQEKERKHLEDCLEQRCHFTPFVVSIDGLIGRGKRTLMKKLSVMLAEKWEKPYAEVCGYVTARMTITIVRVTHRCLRGS
jgi:pantothenate kinase